MSVLDNGQNRKISVVPNKDRIENFRECPLKGQSR